MNNNYDFEIIPSTRGKLAERGKLASGMDRVAAAAADNFDRILDVAFAVVEIQKMQVQADASIRMLREKRLMLETETAAYVNRINAETHATVSKLEVIRRMMNDYYHADQDKLSGDEFSKLILDVLDRLEASGHGVG